MRQVQNFTKQITFENILETTKISWMSIKNLKTHKATYNLFI